MKMAYVVYKGTNVAHILNTAYDTIYGDGRSTRYSPKWQRYDTLPAGLTVCNDCIRAQRKDTAINIKIDKKVQVSIADVIKAMEENGYVHKHGAWFDYDKDGNLIAACILGQAAINLGIRSDDLAYGLNLTAGNAGASIMRYNDNGSDSYSAPKVKRSYGTVLKYAKKRLESYADRKFFATKVEYRAIKKADRA